MTNLAKRVVLKWTPVFGLCLTVASCQKPFDVNVNAPEPIKVDMSMDVHVYHHGEGAVVKKTPGKNVEAEAYKAVIERRRNRMADIQTMKDDRIIGENHLGLLSVLISEGDNRNWPLEYVQKTVNEENEDRSFLVTYDAEAKGKSIREMQRIQWTHWQKKSHPGEWIEVIDPDNPEIYVWVQKKSAAGDRG